MSSVFLIRVIESRQQSVYLADRRKASRLQRAAFVSTEKEPHVMHQPAEIRGLSAGRPLSGPIVELRAPVPLRPDLRSAFEPAALRFGPPKVVTREHTNNAVRWKPGERLNHLLQDACARFAESDAVVTDNGMLSYRDLDRRANQVARHLIAAGVKPGDRVGLLFDKSAETYVAMLAVMKANAAYVPLDASFPVDRIRYIVADAEISAIVSMGSFEERLAPLDVLRVYIDKDKRAIDAEAVGPFTGVAPTYDPLCYIIYTSGTTVNRKAVAIAHASICNFVGVAAGLYGYVPGDRVFQGRTIAFDFSIEEYWGRLMAGATL